MSARDNQIKAVRRSFKQYSPFPFSCGGKWSTREAYHIAGNFRGRKLLQIGKKYDFRAVPKYLRHQILRTKFLQIATKLRNPRKFSPSKVSRYMVLFAGRGCKRLQQYDSQTERLTRGSRGRLWQPHLSCSWIMPLGSWNLAQA